MIVKGTLIATAAVLTALATASGTQAGEVEISNRVAVPCILKGPDITVALDAKSSKKVTIDDELDDPRITVTCQDSGLDKDETQCKLLIGGAGGSGQVTDKAYPFRYVNKIHVFPNLGRFLVCSSI